jgi:signal transduction histidine kinase
MHTPSALLTSPPYPDLRPPPDTRLHGHRRWLVQAACAAVAGVAILLFLISLPIGFALWRTVCASPPCISNQISPNGVQVLHDFGLSVSFYALYLVGLNIIVATVFLGSALVLVIRKPDDWLALFVAVMLVTFGTFTFSDTKVGLTTAYPDVWLPAQFIAWFGDVSIMLFLFLFPTGLFVPRWARFVLVLWGVMQGLRLFFPETAFNLQHSAQPLYNLLFSAGLVVGMVAQLYRYQRIAGPAQRQQTKWVVFSVTVALAGTLLTKAPFQGFQSEQHLPLLLALGTVQVLFILLIPISIAVAVIRYRLWEIDPIINRTLVYGALTVSVISLYILIVGGLGTIFQAQGNFVSSMLATGVVAVLFEPLRARLQRGANRLMYGERDDPYAVIARLGQRLENTLAPAAVLPTVVETVREALKLPYVAITLKRPDSDDSVAAATTGEPMPTSLRLPLVYQGEPVGQLLLAARAPGEPFSPADRRLLDALAHQAGIAAHAVRLTLDLRQVSEDLQRSRERIISAREEERRRLRRDLHDGLGPALANVTLQIETARDLLLQDPERADKLLADLTVKAQSAITDIRRLVYDLRPPALDEFGLVFALREQAAHYDHTGLHTSISAPEPLPGLPAAVEVAAYRIGQEALTNIARHAQARNCWINLETDSELCLEISDDGRGRPAQRHSGVGLASMRERAEELGGTFLIESPPGQGVRVVVHLPLS